MTMCERKGCERAALFVVDGRYFCKDHAEEIAMRLALLEQDEADCRHYGVSHCFRCGTKLEEL